MDRDFVKAMMAGVMERMSSVTGEHPGSWSIGIEMCSQEAYDFENLG
jgi:hypothetical protein